GCSPKEKASPLPVPFSVYLLDIGCFVSSHTPSLANGGRNIHFCVSSLVVHITNFSMKDIAPTLPSIEPIRDVFGSQPLGIIMNLSFRSSVP
ncbi:MAG: hypothetical protein ACXVAB_15000, partial [Thermodesulfobacteriota bacterium]